MARLSVLSDEVQGVVRSLVPLLLETGSTAAVCRSLNQALAESGDARQLHPNRIHALLSDDLGRGVNDATLSAAKAAVEALADKGFAKGEERLKSIRERAIVMHASDGADLTQIAGRLHVPRAIVRAALFDGDPTFGLTDAGASTPAGFKGGPPDWSYQDEAVARVLDAFRRRPQGRIGLVLPTGAGKTRIALRIILERLAQAEAEARVIWVTHRKALKRQADQQLAKLLESGTPLPDNADQLANRIIFAMVAEIPQLLAKGLPSTTLIVVDEGHHAAASSYLPLFEPRPSCPVLLLTATPNRPDQLPIGIEEIAYTITYRELAERRAILIPEFLPFQVPDFDWSPASLDDLVDTIIDETAGRFRKVLLLAPRVDRVEEFYERLVDRLQFEAAHPLSVDDVGYIHGTGNSLGIADEDFLDRFADKPRAVLVSAQILLEGFDDPTIDTVILTYPTSSVIRLMQAAGRCVRQHPGKQKAFVVQANNEDLAYRFDQRWLYQDISDFLRPELVDISYGDPAGRLREVERLLDAHRVPEAHRTAALKAVGQVPVVEPLRMLFFGLPYFGPQERFETDAAWGAFVETPENRTIFRHIFNGFCDLGANLGDPTDFLEKEGAKVGLIRDLAPGSLWRQLAELLTAAYCARQELYGAAPYGIQGNRPASGKGPSTWLRYATLEFRPLVPAGLSAFLEDCHNRSLIEAQYLSAPDVFACAIKVPLPLEGHEAALLEPHTWQSVDKVLGSLTATLRSKAPADRYAALAAALSTADPLPLKNHFASRVEYLLGDRARQERILILTDNER